MPSLTEGMVQLNVPISEELRDLIDQEVIRRCGYPKRGILGEVVTEALKEFLYKRHTHTQNNTQETQTQKKVEGVTNSSISNNNNRQSSKYTFLIESIKKYGNEHYYTISHNQVIDLIQRIFGRDKRTIEKYLELLARDVVICPNDDGTYITPKPKRQEIEVS